MDFWEWNFGDGFIQLNESNSSVDHRYSVGGMKDFVLTVMDRDSCYDQFFTKIKVEDDYDVPNVITPNLDGKNDLLVMFDKIYARYDIQVYNRWGNVIVDKKNQTDVLLWDGTDGDENVCEEGVYFYVIRGILQNGSTLDKKGFVTLMKD
jgi:gliding motility-associated-like protein